MKPLQGRVAIVTGAGKGLGRAYALALAAQGASVLVNNRRHPGESDEATSAAQTAAAIRAAGGEAIANWADVRERDSGTAMVAQALHAWGRLDIVVANAGVVRGAAFHKTDIGDFLDSFETNFHGNLYLAHAAWPVLREAGYGRMVLTTSSAGFYGNHGLAAYAAGKGAVIALMRSLAAEGASRDIRVNAVSPYAVTQMTRAHHPPEHVDSFSTDQVAPLVCWLASAACDVSGEIFVAGGGGFRRAYAVETGTVRTPRGTAIAEGVVAPLLAADDARGYSSAQASFATFLADVTGEKKPGA